MTTLADLRRDYASRALTEDAADADPIRQFGAWFDEALQSQLIDVNAMTLATASPGGEPAARIVLLKGVDESGFVFYSNYESAKGRDLAANPRACLLFFWAELERQVRITGAVTRTTSEESESYFHSRPFESQIGAAISNQSRPVSDRSQLETRYAEFAAKYQRLDRAAAARTGAAIASSRRRLNSGRAARAACTIDCSTRARPTARGRARDSNRRSGIRHQDQGSIDPSPTRTAFPPTCTRVIAPLPSCSIRMCSRLGLPIATPCRLTKSFI